MTRSTLADRLMAERINYGGVAMTRQQVYRDIQRRFPENPRYGIGSADWWAFSPKALTDEEASNLIQPEPCIVCGAPIMPEMDMGHDEGCVAS